MKRDVEQSDAIPVGARSVIFKHFGPTPGN